jgi:hypothetical protein
MEKKTKINKTKIKESTKKIREHADEIDNEMDKEKSANTYGDPVVELY